MFNMLRCVNLLIYLLWFDFCHLGLQLTIIFLVSLIVIASINRFVNVLSEICGKFPLQVQKSAFPHNVLSKTRSYSVYDKEKCQIVTLEKQ